MNKKRAQMKLSFGMIFSILLIIIFIIFAFYAIQKFLDIQNSVQVGKFTNEFQLNVDKIWKGSQGSEKKEFTLPKKIIFACFVDYSSEERGGKKYLYKEIEQLYYGNENLFFYPIGSAQGIDGKEIKHIDLERITENDNPFCVENIDGKINFIIKKDFGETLVTISSAKNQALEQTEQSSENIGETIKSQTHNVEIKGHVFSPRTLTIKKDDRVVWTNMDSSKHTVTSYSGNKLDSILLSKQGTYSHIFDKVGKYTYTCSVHSNMEGTIIVE